MKAIQLNTTAFPYVGQPLTKRWKENGKWKERRGYMFISVYPGMRVTIMNPDGELRTTDFLALCDCFVWEDKDKQPIYYKAE
ncbi:hypothetical protein key_040 [Erwinia phage KEY]|uniref:Uncharacterized protein n=2 Tax=Keyvirus TaxID=3152642 RepID=A0AAE7WAY2_9CAUD|nr:hypothetical protein AAS21_gp040 [Pantoea phage vB_PagS_AAS21]QYC51531.1 hypothetical protein key_040 [Erwinia phage KEY]